MSDAIKAKYATKAKVEHAVRMARLAGIVEIGAIELGPDGRIRIDAAQPAPKSSPEAEIAAWRAKRGKR